MIQNNKQLVDENNDLLDRVQSSQNYASELKARYVNRLNFVIEHILRINDYIRSINSC